MIVRSPEIKDELLKPCIDIDDPSGRSFIENEGTILYYENSKDLGTPIP